MSAFSISRFSSALTTNVPTNVSTTGMYGVCYGPNYYVLDYRSSGGVQIFNLTGDESTNTWGTFKTGGGYSGTTTKNLGISNDGTKLYFVPNSTNTLLAANSSDLTLAASSQTMGRTFSSPLGKISQDSNGKIYICDGNNVYQVNPSDGTTVTLFGSGIANNNSDTSIWVDGDGNQYLFFSSFNGSSQFWIGYINLTTASFPISAFDGSQSSGFLNVPSGFSLTPFTGAPGFSLTCDTLNNILFLTYPIDKIIRQFSLSASSGVPSVGFDTSDVLTVSGPSASTTAIVCNSSAGDAHNNLRLFGCYFSGSTCNIYKIYSPSSSGNTAPFNNTVGIGGDPHIKDLKGNEKIITPEDPFLFLDTLASGDSLHSERVYIWCDSFNIGKNKNLVSAYQYKAVDNKESFLKNIYFLLYNRKIQLDMTTLDVIFDEKISPEENDKISFSISEKIDCREIPFGEYPIIKNEKYRNDLLLFRKIEIIIFSEGNTQKLNFEIIRTKCINYSDITLSFQTSSLSSYEGVVMDCQKEYPLIDFSK